MLPTRRALLIGAAVSPLAALGYWVPWALDGVVAVDVALLLLVVLDAWLAPVPPSLPGVSAPVAVRRDAPPAFSLGRANAVRYVWTNAAPRAARLRVREERPGILGGLMPARTLVVGRRAAFVERLEVRAERRGRETAGALRVETRGPLGLGRRRVIVPLPWAVVVYPPLDVTRLRAAVADARRRDPGLRAVRQLGEGRLFESLREWVPGDDIRSIDWKATARRRKVITRQYEAERRQQVLLVLDTGRLMTAEVGGVARLEFVVRAALELAATAVHQDDNVGVMAFAAGVSHFVAPSRGRPALERVLEVLAVVQPELVEPDYPGAFRYLAVRNRKRALTVLFTDVVDRAASEALVANVASLRPRHLPLAVTLRNPELDRIASARSATAEDAYRKAAAEELLRARDDALGRMRGSGVLVLDVPPARAAAAVVTQYRDLKRRGVL